MASEKLSCAEIKDFSMSMCLKMDRDVQSQVAEDLAGIQYQVNISK